MDRNTNFSEDFQKGLNVTDAAKRMVPKILTMEAWEDNSVSMSDIPGHENGKDRFKVRMHDDTGEMLVITRKEALFRAEALIGAFYKDKALGQPQSDRDIELIQMFVRAANDSRIREVGHGYNENSLTTLLGPLLSIDLVT